MIQAMLTSVQILDAAEEVLRRFGPGKATVVDVARALGVTHGSVYRHFPSKAALRDAVAERWLERVSAPLAAIVRSPEPALRKLRRWLEALASAKRRKALDDPELFATYHAIALESRDVVGAHVKSLIDQLTEIIEEGVAAGEFRATNAPAAARAVLDATARFHNPAHAGEWSSPGLAGEFEAVWSLILAGLTAGSPKGQARFPIRKKGARSRRAPSSR